MMTAEKLAELYTIVLLKEEALEIAREKLAHTSKNNKLEYENLRRQTELARDALQTAQKNLSVGITDFGKTHRNIPFFRKTKTFTAKLKHKTVKFYFDQRGIPTIA